MDIASKLEKEVISGELLSCLCLKFPVFLHSLNQSLQTIHAYAGGCKKRLEIDSLNNEQLKEVLSIITDHVDRISCMTDMLALS